jgi:transcriptional regulator with XRE-family HTH domain
MMVRQITKGPQLKEWRKKHYMTQKKFAELFLCSERQVIRYENDQTAITDNLRFLMQVYDEDYQKYIEIVNEIRQTQVEPPEFA